MPSLAPSQVSQTKELSFNESEDRFRTVFLTSSDALFITDAAGAEFLDANPRACQILGYSRRELLHLPPSRILSWKLGAIDWRQPAPERAVKGAFCRQKSGLQIPCDASACPVRFNQKSCTLVSIRAVTQRQLAETLKKTFSFARFLNAVATGTAEAPTVEHAIRFCIHQVCDFRCWPLGHARIFAKRFIAFRVPADIWYFGLGAHSESGAGTIACKLDFSSSDWYPRIASSGRPFISDDLLAEPDFAVKELARALKLRAALVVPLLADKEVVGTLEFFSREAMALDKLLSEMMVSLGARVGRIIELKRAMSRIRDLSSRLFHLRDDERRRLARELHDTTAQHIAAILMDLNVISRRIEVLDTEARTALSECISLARQSLHEVRTFSYLLHPPMLDELGLISALRIYIEGFSERSGMHVAFEPPESYNKLPTDLEVTLFHVVQEGLTNAHRHSGSPWAKVRMSLRPTEISVSVENEQTREVSIKNSRQSAQIGVGIRSLQERVEHFGGRSALHSNAYRTVLEAVFPLSRAAKGAGA
jgi:PAS domain S-box-containing protein